MDKIKVIRSEIEQRMKLAKKNCIESGLDVYDAQVWVLDDMLSFIDSLQQEQPEVGLEKEIDCVRTMEIDYCDGDNTISERLKSLRPHPHWKPSEKQMKALEKVTFGLIGTGTETDYILESLYNDLKKLMED